jgi:hypothetical protein
LLQVSLKEYVLIVFSGPTVSEPRAAFAPLQSSPPVHAVGLLETDQVIVVEPPGVTEPIVELPIVTTGRFAGGVVLFTVVVAKPLPASFLHVRVYVLVVTSAIAAVFSEPLAALPPLQEPLAVQDVGLLVELQTNVLLSLT